MAKLRFIFFTFIMVFLSSVNGQILKDQDARQLVQETKKIWFNQHDSILKYIEFETSEKAGRIISAFNLEKELKLSAGSTFSKIDNYVDRMGIEHLRQQQVYKGIPVEGAVYKLHGRAGKLERSNGIYYHINNLDVKPEINESAAYNQAIKYFTKRIPAWKTALKNRSNGKLIILPSEQGFVLAYKFDLYSAKPLMRNYIYVNASTGEVVKVEDRIRMEDAVGTALTKYHNVQPIYTEKYNSSYRLNDYTRGNGIQTLNLAGSVSYARAIDFTDEDNLWNANTDQDDAATSIHYSIEKAYDFFLNRFGRNSFNNNGAVIQSYVHYDTTYNNAFWDGDQLFFGDGDGIKYNAFASTDVVAHEFTHALTDYAANLNYSGEAGALNESFSDIFGVAVDFYANPSTANFIIGDQISISGKGIRNMSNPNQLNHPDTYKGQYWYSGTNDNGGVHTNCAVSDYWFYLLCNGGTGANDFGNAYSVNGIGVQKATDIAYRTLTVYLTSNSGFEDARFYSIQSAIDLFGVCSAEVISVTNSWYAVGVGEAFSSDVKAEFEISQTTGCSLPLKINFVNKCSNALKFFWDFGDGSTSTESNPEHIYTTAGNYTVMLVANGNQLCNSTDTIIRDNLVSLSASGLTATSCVPKVINPSEAGIVNLSLGDIDNSSSLSVAEGGYIDFSCNAYTNIVAGQRVPVSVTTNPESDENVKIWIDANDDGSFSENEQVFSSNAHTGLHTGYIIVPEPSVFIKPLRLRVISDFSTLALQSACFEIQSGQAEDYAVTIMPNYAKPVADFGVAKSVVIPGDSLSFLNLSLNIPTSFEWTFAGGSPSHSTLKNPKVVYSEPGDYTVTLKVKNAYGEDIKTIQEIVKVRNPIIIGEEISSSESEGILFDAGGPSGKYFNNENSVFTITNPCALEIRLAFQMIDIENGSDLITIYDGTDQNSPLLYPLSGSTKFDTLVAKSGNMYVKFTSDGSVTKRGFALEWTSINVENAAVTADFIAPSLSYNANEIISFTNKSSDNANNWLWEFDDGSTSADKNPKHAFNEAGIKNIKLIASNCYSSDTITKQIVVLPSSTSYAISIPDQIMKLGELKTIDILNILQNIVVQEVHIDLLNSDYNVIYAAANNSQIILQSVEPGESVVTLNVTINNYLISDTFNVNVVDDNKVEAEDYYKTDFKTYPNPVHDDLNIVFENEPASQIELAIYSSAGQKIVESYLEITNKAYQLNVSDLRPGVYILVVRSKDIQYTGKFVRR